MYRLSNWSLVLKRSFGRSVIEQIPASIVFTHLLLVGSLIDLGGVIVY